MKSLLTSSDITSQSASSLVHAIRNRQISSRELLGLYVGQIETMNPQINAVITLDLEAAEQQAAAADNATANGKDLGPLHGLPMTIKDTLETAGMRTTAGSPELVDHVPSHDADAVARLRKAGTVIFGKTNAPTYARDIQTHNPIFGTTNNPHDLTRTAGGSSGGSAAALASAMTGFELGSDLAGSARLPAHYCGVFALRPSYGIIPTRGHIPRPPGMLTSNDLVTIAPLGRSAEDLDLGLSVLAGPNDEESVGWQLRLPPPRATELADYRIGAWLDDPHCPTDSAVANILTSFLETLGQASARIDDITRPVDLPSAERLFQQLLYGATSGGIPQDIFDTNCAQADAMDPEDDSPNARLLRGSTQRLREWNNRQEQRQQLRRRWSEYFRNHDVLLCPVAPTAAINHAPDFDARYLLVNGERRPFWDQTLWSGLATAANLPAAAVPIGLTTQGLPVGIQIIGPYLEDRTVTAIARHVARIAGTGQ